MNNEDVILVPVVSQQATVETQKDVLVFVPLAHQNKPGIVKAGDGVLIENGVVSLNRQTVEDMIDANKWVSYGFQQNLTNEEKGLARHNIGAGDNDFTGSYYDVTQKPHLKTDNTNSLNTGDEEINHTINLHKVSKTGSFVDLNDAPIDTINFAEAERQKSKNLFNATMPQSVQNNLTYSADTSKIYLTGTTTAQSITKFGYSPLKKGTYTMCFEVASGTLATGMYMNLYIGGTTNRPTTQQARLASDTPRNYATFTLTEDYESLQLGTYIGTGGVSLDNVVINYQIVEGNKADYDFQAYQGGAITHNGDEPVVFAESERQKSKNLFNKDGVILNTWLEGGVVKPQTGFCTTNYIKIDGQPYTVSATSLTSGSTQAFYDANKNFIRDSSLSTYTGTNIPPADAVYVRSNYKIAELNNNIQYEIGTQATDYQPYNGPITHNGDAPVVFAANERQKSKNLFNYRDYLNLVSIYDYKDSAGYYTKRIVLKPNTTYTLSFPTKEETSPILLLNKTESVNAGGYLDTRKTNDVKTYTTDSTGYLYIGVVGSNDTNVNNLLSTLNLQIEEGLIATDYQPYNGPITHNGDAPVAFAETERQKTLNLFNPNSYAASPNVTVSQINTGVRITSSNNGGYKYGLFTFKANVKSGQTLYFHADTSGTGQVRIRVDGGTSETSFTELYGSNSLNFSIPLSNNYEYIRVYLYATYTEEHQAGVYIDYANLMLSTEPYTSYQPYNGQIVHENDVFDVVKTSDVTKFEKTENKTDSFSIIDNTKYPSMLGLSYAHQGGLRYGFTGENDDDLLNWVKNEAPVGYYHFYWSHGSVEGVDVMKASSQYATVVKTDYWISSPRYINCLAAGEWSGWKKFLTN